MKQDTTKQDNGVVDKILEQLKEPDHKNIGDQLRAIRTAANKEQGEVAAKIGISSGYLSELERGKRNWSSDLVVKFVAACK